MIVSFFTDIHGNGYAFREFLKQQDEICPDRIIFGGDVFGYYYDCEDILTRLRTDGRFICILGNHDEMFLKLLSNELEESFLIERYGNSYLNITEKISSENVSFIKSWPEKFELKDNGFLFGFFHGGPEDPIHQRIYPDTIVMNTNVYEKYDFIYCGHTHHKHERMIGKCRLINIGSLGQQRDGKGCTYAIIDTVSGKYEIRTVNYDIEALKRDILKKETSESMIRKLMDVLSRGNNR